MDKQLKTVAMKKARKDGWTLSAFLNFATREYVSGNLRGSVLRRDLAESRASVKRGEYISQEDLFEKLGL